MRPARRRACPAPRACWQSFCSTARCLRSAATVPASRLHSCSSMPGTLPACTSVAYACSTLAACSHTQPRNLIGTQTLPERLEVDVQALLRHCQLRHRTCVAPCVCSLDGPAHELTERQSSVLATPLRLAASPRARSATQTPPAGLASSAGPCAQRRTAGVVRPNALLARATALDSSHCALRLTAAQPQSIGGRPVDCAAHRAARRLQPKQRMSLTALRCRRGLCHRRARPGHGQRRGRHGPLQDRRRALRGQRFRRGHGGRIYCWWLCCGSPPTLPV